MELAPSSSIDPVVGDAATEGAHTEGTLNPPVLGEGPSTLCLLPLFSRCCGGRIQPEMSLLARTQLSHDWPFHENNPPNSLV